MAKRSKSKKAQTTKVHTQKKQPKFKITDHPNWIYLGLVFIALLIFFAPAMLENKTLLPPDTVAAKSIEPFVKDNLKEGTYPLWNPYLFGGMPSFASLTSAPYIDMISNIYVLIINGLKLIFPLSDFTRIFVNYFLMGCVIFLLLRTKSISREAALYSAMAAVFLPQLIAYTAFGHNSKLATMLLFPIVFLMVERLLEKRNLLFFSLTALAVGLQLLRAHVQICFYTYFMVGVYLVYWFVLEIRAKSDKKQIASGAGLLIGALLIGLVMSSVLYLSVYEYSHFSIRGGGTTGGLDFSKATSWSFPPSEITTYFVPSFMGFGRETYWGPMPFTDFPLYFGIITFLLAGLALVLKRNKVTRFFTLFAGIALILSFGRHLPILYGPMYKFVPFFNKFRAPKMIQITIQVAMTILAGFGLQGIIELAREKNARVTNLVQRYLLIFGGVVIFLLLFLLLAKSAYLGWAEKAGQYKEAAYDKALGDAYKALFLWLGAFVSILMTLKAKINARVLPFLLIGLLLIDVWPVSKRFVEFRPKAQVSRYFAETPEVSFLKQKDKPFRIIATQDQRNVNWYMRHKIQNAFGYQGAKLRLYDELANAFGLPAMHEGDVFFQKYLKVANGQYAFRDASEVSKVTAQKHLNFLKLMNVKYIVTPYQLPDTSYQMIYTPAKRGANGVLAVKHGLPRAYFPKQIQSIKDGQTVLNYMTLPVFDPEAVSFIEEEPPFQVSGSDENVADVTHFDIHHIKIQAKVTTPACMVVSEMYYPAGWKAYVDGKETKIYKANYAFRALFLQPGEHEIEFVFSPVMFKAGFAISLSTFLLLLVGIFIGWKKSNLKTSSGPITEVEN